MQRINAYFDQLAAKTRVAVAVAVGSGLWAVGCGLWLRGLTLCRTSTAS